MRRLTRPDPALQPDGSCRETLHLLSDRDLPLNAIRPKPLKKRMFSDEVVTGTGYARLVILHNLLALGERR